MDIGRKILRSGRLWLLLSCVGGLPFATDCNAQDTSKSEYFRQNGKDSVIVFVHGVLGDSRSTWTNSSTSAYWPALMKADPFFNDFDIFVIGYPSALFHSSYRVDELVEVLRRDLDSADVFAKHKHVYFLCHSMGGLVVREYLTRYGNRASQVPMIYFFSTPTTGAEIASLGALLSTNRQMQGLLPININEYLASIRNNWLAAQFSIAAYCAYETQDTNGIRIVGESSATNLCNRRLDPINANHLNIVKPRDATDAPYTAFRNALREVTLSAQQTSSPKKALKSASGKNRNEATIVPENCRTLFAKAVTVRANDLGTDRFPLAQCRMKYRPEDLDLHDLFAMDFAPDEHGSPLIESMSYQSIPYFNGKTNTRIEVEYGVIQLLQAGSKFIVFYIPDTPDTLNCASWIALQSKQIGLGQIGPHMEEKGKIPGDSEQLDSKLLGLSTQMYVYHETFLSSEQTVEVKTAFKKEGVLIVMHGDDYLSSRKQEIELKKLRKLTP
jgi:pimeloyl-ACP methyl ester carboxylesterase